MALSDRKMPIVEGVNDIPSSLGSPSHPNGALMCQKYNDLIDNELSTIENNIPSTTDDLSEGTTNKYYSDSASRASISLTAGTSGATYDNTTGVLDFTNLQTGISDLSSFTTDDLVEGTTNKYIDANTVKKNEQNVYTKSQTVQTVSLVDGANIAVDASLGNVFSITLAGDRTIDNPTNLESGQLLIFKVTQDSTGTRLLTWDTAYKFSNDTPPTLTTTANKVDIISCVSDGTNLYCDAKLNF